MATAPDQLIAEIWRSMLEEEGIPAVVRPGDVIPFLGSASLPVRLLVDERRKEEALALLTEEFEAGAGDRPQS